MTTIQYKCPNCGGPLQWSATKQTFACDYCGSEFTEEQLKIAFPDIEGKTLEENVEEPEVKEFEENTSLYRCGSCGAEIIAETTTAATFCYYCHNPVIIEGRLSGDYKPSHVIPFVIEREKALTIFKEWCSKKWFLPNDFKSEQQLEKMTGVYIPFWLADCKADARMTAMGKKVNTWQSGDRIYTRTKEYSVKRSAIIDYMKVPADGSSKAENSLMEAIEPFDYTAMKPFSMSYLSGYLAEKYDIKNIDVLPRIKERVTSSSESILRESITGYSMVIPQNKNINLIKTTWNYTLFPVWFMTYKHRDKSYYFSINGQTGKLAGTPPFDTKKGVLFSAGIGLLASVLLGIIMIVGGIV
ncbi:MAG: hypothetical protein J5992_04910 [Oscillospiraceae bacterium]|nr:hypothetical protein [Oscillospiraceae bacterium]